MGFLMQFAQNVVFLLEKCWNACQVLLKDWHHGKSVGELPILLYFYNSLLHFTSNLLYFTTILLYFYFSFTLLSTTLTLLTNVK
jgi:hypothetical protein